MANLTNLPKHPTSDDFEQELIFQNIMLEALDPEDDDYIQKLADAEVNVAYLHRALGIDNETMSQGGLSQDIMSPGTMSQGNMSQGSWEHMPMQPFKDTSNQFGSNQFGFTDLNGMATNSNGGGTDFDWMLGSMYEGECTLFLIVIPLRDICGV